MRVFKALAATLVLFLVGGGITSLNAQTKKVSGTVLDTQQQPLVGVGVIQQGTRNGTMTNPDGTFTLNVPGGQAVVLEVSSLGYTTQNVTVPASQGAITVILEEDNLMLSETVVVGYGTQKKVNLTGAISTVASKDLEKRVSANLTNMLQGSVPGLNITTSSGVPGSAGSINIRGYNSINSAAPIVVIDGSIGDLSRVNPNDVESISVIKDAAAAAVYGARAAFGVILVTTKTGSTQDGKATVRYSGRWGWEENTTSTDYEDRGYWSVYAHNLFWASNNDKYIRYTDHDMMELLARVNDKTEHPDRPWVVEEVRNGKKQWVYYANTDWYHELFRDQRPSQQHNISVSGGTKDLKYYISGNYQRQEGIMKINHDIYNKYNLRAKFDAKINKWATISNNSAIYSNKYSYIGVDNVQNAITYSARHALACFPLTNPDGSYIYSTPYTNYKLANGRHIVFDMGKDTNVERRSDFTNVTELKIKPVKQFTLTANYTYRFYQSRDTHRRVEMPYREYPGQEMQAYSSGAGLDHLDESVNTYNYYSANVFGTYEDTFKDAHHLTVMAGFNWEARNNKSVGAEGQYLLSEDLNDLDLVGPNSEGEVLTTVSGGQSEYALAGFFGRVNYDYKGRYLFEASARYDGTSRFASGNRWGFFPSASAGWRISEEPFFKPARKVIDNLKLRASFGTLGNQNVSNFAYLRTVSISDFKGYTFNEGTTMSKYSSLSAPNASDLTWEKTEQWNLGLDASFFKNRLEFTGEIYIRDTKDMLTAGIALPGVYGEDSPKMNSADLRTKGYELSLSWRDQFKLWGKPFNYNVRATLSDYRSEITKFDNPEKSFAKNYYKGMRIGDIWGFEVDGLFKTTEEAQEYAKQVDLSYINKRLEGGWQAGDLKFVDLDGDRKLSIGQNTAEDPGDRKIIGNSLPSLSYGITLGFDYMGFDFSIFLQGTGNHYWYPAPQNQAFWGLYSGAPYLTYLPKNYLDNIWSEENPNTYFPRPRAYSASTGGAQLRTVNDRYLQNLRYLRLKSLVVGYTVPAKLTRVIGLDNVRVYFSGENLQYWSPLKKHTKYLDPEASFTRSSAAYDNAFYPWPKTFMFGIDITF